MPLDNTIRTIWQSRISREYLKKPQRSPLSHRRNQTPPASCCSSGLEFWESKCCSQTQMPWTLEQTGPGPIGTSVPRDTPEPQIPIKTSKNSEKKGVVSPVTNKATYQGTAPIRQRTKIKPQSKLGSQKQKNLMTKINRK